MNERDHNHDEAPKTPVPLMAEDAGSRALTDALRSSFVIVKFIMAGLVVLFFASGFFTVGPQERAIVLRFGKPLGEGEAALRGPGAHWAWPYPIDKVEKVPFSQVQSADSTVGWYATTPEQQATGTEPPPGETLNPARDSYVLTGDANIIHVRATLRYRITDPLRYILGFTNAAGAVTNALNNALCLAAAQFSVDDALTRNQTAFRERIERHADQLAANRQLGIAVEQVTVSSIAPRQLTEKFRAASEAAQRSERVTSEARTYANETLGRAQGEAASRIGVAESERSRLVEAVRSEADVFTKLLPEYRKNPGLLMRTWQAEVVGRVFTNAQEIWFRPAGMEDRLNVSRQPLKPPAAAPAAPKEDHH